MTTRANETVGLAALIQAVMGKLYLLYRRNLGFREYRRELIEENKWRAVRYGLDGSLIDFGKMEQVPVRALIGELLEFCAETSEIFGSQHELERIRTILKEGTSADRQLAVYRATGDLRAVVQDIVEQTKPGAGGGMQG